MSVLRRRDSRMSSQLEHLWQRYIHTWMAGSFINTNTSRTRLWLKDDGTSCYTQCPTYITTLRHKESTSHTKHIALFDTYTIQLKIPSIALWQIRNITRSHVIFDVLDDVWRFTVLWSTTPCSLVDKYQQYGTIYCLYLRVKEQRGSSFHQFVGTSLSDYTVSHPTGP
jgi:hypothetical protein